MSAAKNDQLEQGILALFVCLPDALARRKMLVQLEKMHEKMLKDKTEPGDEE